MSEQAVHEDTRNNSQNHRRKRVTLGILISLVVICAVAVALFIRISSSPANGVIIENTLADSSSTTTKTLETPYYTLEYSSIYELQSGLTKGADQLDLQVFVRRSTKNSLGSIRASLGIEKLPANGVKEMSHYKLAQAFPKSYRIEARQTGTDASWVITKYDDGTNKVLLWPHKTYVFVLALSTQSSGDMPDYDSFIDEATGSFIWKDL